MCRILCKCPGATLTARIKHSAGQCPKCGHRHPAPLWRTTTHLTYLLLLKFQVAVSLQNTSLLSCLNFVRAQGLRNPSPAVSDHDRLVFKMLVTCEGQHRGHAAEEQDLGHGVLWIHPCWRPQGSPATYSTQRGQEAAGILYHPAARMPSNSNMSVPQRSQGDLLSPAHVCLCTALCTVLALEETKMNHSQTWRQKKVTTGNYYFFFFFRFCGGGGSSGVIFTKNP